jgi:tetratricopeptide (TPR) repeat protein
MNRPITTALALSLAAATALPLAGCNKHRRAARPARTETPIAPPPAAAEEAQQAVARAHILSDQGLDEIAVAEFERAIAINPRMTTAYMGVAQIYRKKGDFGKAEQGFAKAAELEPTNFDAHYGRGLMLQLLNRVAEAIKAYLRALQLKPNDFDGNLNLATAYLQIGEPAAGLPFGQRAVSLNASSGPARVNLGAIYTALGDHESAVVEYQQAAELMPLTPELLLNLADALGKTARYAEMQNTLEQLIRLQPSATAHERLATALFRQRKFDDAMAQFRKAVELDANYYPALNGIGVSMLNQYLLSNKKDLNALNEGLSALRRSVQIEPRQPAVVDLIARYG